jgi:hypothetical protein
MGWLDFSGRGVISAAAVLLSGIRQKIVNLRRVSD